MAKYKFPDLTGFPDCMALSDNGKCSRLTVSTCLGQVCTIKQTHKEYMDSVQFANHRLSRLDSSIQKHIADKYYRGNMPWTKTNSN